METEVRFAVFSRFFYRWTIDELAFPVARVCGPVRKKGQD
jgi:hypothetical protein